MSGKIEIAGNRHMETLGNCGGYYSCPKDANGRRLGPLVGYAGKYEAPDGKMLQFVGDIYANFSKAEIHPSVLGFFAVSLCQRLYSQIGLDKIDGGVIGAPIGGYSLADAIGLAYPALGITILKAEKKVTRLATEELREQSKLVFARHDIEPGRNYVIVEDVCNNFSTTEELIRLIQSLGGRVLAIACFLNRSLVVNETFPVTDQMQDGPGTLTNHIPVISLVRLPINEWRQDDPAVAEDIAKGNVILKPKNEWARLMEAMSEHPVLE
ncbi:MAG: phosphoribosyltransferase [Candidatus Paceibacterota bacterium]